MFLRKFFITVILFLSATAISDVAFAKETKKDINQVLQEVDAKVQAALNAIPGGNAQEVVSLIKAVSESSQDLSANYKFEFERDKVVAKVRKAREAAQKSDLSAAEQELKSAKEGFANLKKFL